MRRKDVDPAALTRVILCDVRQKERIGVVAEWLEANPDVEVWAYDHHPDTESDVEARGGIVGSYVEIPASTSVEEAKAVLNTRRVNAAPVVGPEGRMMGIVSRQILDAALQHGLGGRPVSTT